MALAAATIVAVLALNADGAETGLLQTAQTLPFLILSLPAGVVADRVSRRGLMVAAEAARAVSLALILALVITSRLSLPLLAALGFLGATGTVAYTVAAPALAGLSRFPGTRGRVRFAGDDHTIGQRTQSAVPEKPPAVSVFSLIARRASIAGSMIGGMPETQEMLDYCGKHNIAAEVEVIPIDRINEAFERMLKQDVKYRFVIDMASLK